MEFRLTFLILIALALFGAGLFRFILKPLWKRSIDWCRTADSEDAQEKELREQAERELHSDVTYPDETRA